MSSISRIAFYGWIIIFGGACPAQRFPAVTASSAVSVTSDSQPQPGLTNNFLGTPAQDSNDSLWPRPFLYAGLALSKGASYSPAAGAVGGGFNLESNRLIALVETSLQNAHKQDSGTGTEVDLKGRAFYRTTPGWYFGGGAQWSKLDTVAYDKQAWRPVFGGGKDVFRENFSLRAQILYVLPGTDHLNAVQGPEISLWLPSPAAHSHFFYRQTVGIYEFHQTSVPGNSGTNERYAASFVQLTAMCRF